jgi:hypothetical protein
MAVTQTVSPATPGGVQAQTARVVENGAGVYTSNFILPPGATLIDIIVEAEALWTAATSAVMDIGDSADPDGYYSAVDLKATDLLAGESLSIGSTQTRGGDNGAYLTVGTSTHISRRFSSAARTIAAVITSVGAGTAGRTRITVVFTTQSPTEVTQ